VSTTTPTTPQDSPQNSAVQPTTTPAPASFSAALRRALRQPAFLTVAIILGLAAVSLNGATEFLQLHFKKQPVPLRRKLTEIPQRLGPWVQVTQDTAISHEIEETLQTKEYIYRFYVDSRRVPQDVLDEFRDKDVETQRRMISVIQAKDPHAVVNAAVTYYTGMVDTVAHIPDRCYVADGYQPTHYDLKRWDAFNGRKGDGLARYIAFEDQTPERRSVAKNVAYFFHSNGQYVCDPLGVRKNLQNLFETHGYYAKVELLMITPDREEAAGRMNDFLTHALPEVEKCLPDWAAVKAAEKAKSSGQPAQAQPQQAQQQARAN